MTGHCQGFGKLTSSSSLSSAPAFTRCFCTAGALNRLGFDSVSCTLEACEVRDVYYLKGAGMSSFWLSPQEGSLHRSEGALVAIKIAKRARAELGSGSTVRHGKVVANPRHRNA